MGIVDVVSECCSLPRSRRQIQKRKQFQTVEMKVKIDCEGCERKVKKALDGMKGVSTVDVEARQSKVTVTGYHGIEGSCTHLPLPSPATNQDQSIATEKKQFNGSERSGEKQWGRSRSGASAAMDLRDSGVEAVGTNRRTRSGGEKAERKEERSEAVRKNEPVSANACLKELLSKLGPAHKRGPSGDGTKTHRRRAMHSIRRMKSNPTRTQLRVQPSGRPWRRGEGVDGCSVLSIWRKLGESCGVLGTSAYEQLLVHGCKDGVVCQAPVGGGDGCSRFFGDLRDLLGNKARLFSASCAPLWLPWWKKEEGGGVVGPAAAASADFAVPGAALLRVRLLDLAGDPMFGMVRSLAPADASSRRLQDPGVNAWWKLRQFQRG